MAADLICAPRLDSEAQETRAVALHLARYGSESFFSIKRRIDLEMRILALARPYGVISFGNFMRAEHLDGSSFRCVVLCEKKAARRIAVKPVNSLKALIPLLLAQKLLNGTALAAAEHSRRLIAD